MSKKILVVTVLVSNIVFGAVLAVPSALQTTKTKKTNRIAYKSTERLEKRGIERSVARSRISTALENDEYTNELMAHNILKSIPSLCEDDVVAFISSASLKNQKIDLSSYETIISLVQHNSRVLLDKDMIATLEQVSLTNEKFKQLKAIA